MADDIVERLLNRAANAVIIKEKPNLYYDAAHEIERLRAENERLREESITSSKKYYDIGYSCAKDMQKDKIEMLLGLLREAHVKMVENDLWVNLRQRVAAAIRESGE